MKIRTGFVSNSSSSSFCIVVKNNTPRSVTVNEMFDIILPDIIQCIRKRIPDFKKISKGDLLDVKYNEFGGNLIKPGMNKIFIDSDDDYGSGYSSKLLSILSYCKDPKQRFQYTTGGSGQCSETYSWKSDVRKSKFDLDESEKADEESYQYHKKLNKHYEDRYNRPENMDLPSLSTLGLRKKITSKPKPKRKVVGKPVKKVVKKCRCK